MMKSYNNVLAISIPTYNRTNILSENLSVIIEECIPYNIPIYIFDDSTNDDTENLINEISKKYSYIFYKKNKERLGHDYNCVNSLSVPDQEYIWYLGDSMLISKNSVARILSIIQTKRPDFISFKEKNRNVCVETKTYDQAEAIFNDLAWHLTMSGTTVYKKSALNFQSFNIGKFKNFPQLAIIFSSFINDISSLYWLSESLIYGNLKKKSYWTDKIFDVFFTDLKNTYSNLPQNFSADLIVSAVKSHSTKSKLFGYHSLVKMRISNIINYKVYCELYESIIKYTEVNTKILLILCVFPKWLLKIIYQMVRFFIPEKKQML